MNYLAHLHLGGSSRESLLGSLYGDFVKGPLKGNYEASIERAIRVHRAIDSYTDAHPIVLHAKSRFPVARRRFAGILLDVFFDHALAKHWTQFSSTPLDRFTESVYRILLSEDNLPNNLALIAPKMAQHDWLGSYHDFEVLQLVIDGIQRRLSKAGVLAGSFAELNDLYHLLESDFLDFYPDLMAFTQTEIKRHR